MRWAPKQHGRQGIPRDLPPPLRAGSVRRARVFHYPPSIVLSIGSGAFVINAPVVTFLPTPMQVPTVRIFVQDADGAYLVP